MGWLVFDRKRCHISKRQCYISPIEPPLQARFANRGRIEDGAARRHPMAPARAARYNGKRTTMAKPLNISPDRLFPAEDKTRDIARALYAEVKALPIVSPHGHTDPAWFATDANWSNATELLLAPDHYLRSEEHTSELQSLMRTSYAVFCLKK